MVIPNTFAQITWLFGGPGQPLGGACTLGAELGLVLDPAIAAEDAYTAWVESVLAFQGFEVYLTGCRVKFGPDATGASAEFSDVEAGGDTGSTASPQVAYLVRKNTALGGRQGRGRMFVPGVPEQAVASTGEIGSTFITGMNTALDSLKGKLEAAELTPVLLHSNALAPTAISTLVCDSRAATQRRRLRR